MPASPTRRPTLARALVAAAAACLLAAPPRGARADDAGAPPTDGGAACTRAVEVRFAPTPGLQLAVWIEDAGGRVVDTLFVTRSTGLLGLANRPGAPRLRSDYRWPYGAREMVLPVWAGRRARHYPRVVMGGAAGPDDDGTIGYHYNISSPEPFYCSPSGAVHRIAGGVDTVSCASPFYGVKGLDATDGTSSAYPPRGDLVSFNEHDSDDAHAFAALNDLAAVSGATPTGDAELTPPLLWIPPAGTPDGDYVVRVEASQEGDFDAAWPACDESDPTCAHPTQLDDHQDLVRFGHDVLGQPSLVWSVPVRIDAASHVAATKDYEGYGSWDGAPGTLGVVHTPDGTIAAGVPHSGAERLLLRSDGDGDWRVKVTVMGCDGRACVEPRPVTALSLTASDSAVTATWDAPAGALRPARYDVRYLAGAPITDATFDSAIPGGTPPAPGPPGAHEQVELTGLKGDTTYSVGVRAVAACGQPSPVAVASVTTEVARFATLSGCFLATAAWGTPAAREIDRLRAWRDRALLNNPVGSVAVIAYYAVGPSLAQVIARDERLRALVRGALVSALAR